jgi:hypothetical protein
MFQVRRVRAGTPSPQRRMSTKRSASCHLAIGLLRQSQTRSASDALLQSIDLAADRQPGSSSKCPALSVTTKQASRSSTVQGVHLRSSVVSAFLTLDRDIPNCRAILAGVNARLECGAHGIHLTTGQCDFVDIPMSWFRDRRQRFRRQLCSTYSGWREIGLDNSRQSISPPCLIECSIKKLVQFTVTN